VYRKSRLVTIFQKFLTNSSTWKETDSRIL